MPYFARTHCTQPVFDVTEGADRRRRERVYLCPDCGISWEEPDAGLAVRRAFAHLPSFFDAAPEEAPPALRLAPGARMPAEVADPMLGINRARRRWRVRLSGCHVGYFEFLAEAQAARDEALGTAGLHGRMVAAATALPASAAALAGAAGCHRHGDDLVAELLAAGWLARAGGGLVRGPRRARPAV